MNIPYRVDTCVPHEPPMLLVEELLERHKTGDDDDRAKVGATVPLDGPFIANGRVLPEYYIELAAQAMAAVDGYDARQEAKTTGEGFLVGVDDFRIFSLVKPGTYLVVSLVKEFAFSGVQIFNATVFKETTRVGKGQIRIWQDKTGA